MKTALALLVAAALAMTLIACGSSGRPTRTGSVTSSTHANTAHKKDRDNDEDNNNDDYHVLGFGHLADPAEHRAIATLIGAYFAAAAAEDGARACSLLAPFVAETVVEQDGHTAALKGSTCSAVMSKLFKQNHAELVGKSAALKVMRVGVEGDRARIALEFPEIPVVRQITARREGHRWSVIDLLDGNIE